MTFPPTCRINRYYDPSTDSFISVDPEVQQTDQPYMFVNGNPLNATDPLGLQGSGGAQAIAAYNKQAAATKAYCDNHPDALGHNCGGLLHEVVGTVAKSYNSASSFANHIVLGIGVCVDVCANVSLQGDTVTFSFGGNGVLTKGFYVGYSNLPASDRQHTQSFIAGGVGAGGSAEFGINPNGSINHSDWEVDTGSFEGVAGGVMWSKSFNL